jgi:uncharacterized membrane protein
MSPPAARVYCAAMATDVRVRAPRAKPRSFVGIRIVAAALTAVIIGVVVALAFKAPTIAPTACWIAFAALFLATTWRVVGGMDAAETATHATREDPTVGASSTILTVASVASLGGVALLLLGAHQGSRILEPALAVTSVVLSWFLVHTLYTLKYAALYYSGPDGGVDFNQKADPDYGDFAYLAFTLGMTYQVSDTSITSRDIRHAALRHGLLSYLLGAVVLASTINLVVGLAK